MKPAKPSLEPLTEHHVIVVIKIEGRSPTQLVLHIEDLHVAAVEAELTIYVDHHSRSRMTRSTSAGAMWSRYRDVVAMLA